MACETPKPVFGGPYEIGMKEARPLRDGYSVFVRWSMAIPTFAEDEIGYNLYFSTNKNTVLSEGPKYFTRYSELTIKRFNPGDIVYFLVRATEYIPLDMTPLIYPPSPQAPNAFIYPETALFVNIDASTLSIPLIDVSEFPPFGVIQIGTELIKYTNVDYGNNIVTAPVDGRGYYNTNIRFHDTDGYDGYVYQDPTVRMYAGWEDLNLIYTEADPRFEPPDYPYTDADGYKQVTKDILTTDLTASDQDNVGFPSYDYAGYHRTSLVDYFSGTCVGSYHGGEQGCDGYKVRGLYLQDRNTQRLEMMLNVTGEPVVLLKRKWTGIRCSCFRLNQEHHEGRCSKCFATGFVGGYDQYYYPRRSDRRIMMRFGATVDDLTIKQYGLEQNFVPNCWTLVIPAIKDRDVLIRFNEDNTEEFRYEVVNVTRNKLMFSLSGAQALQIYRLDKTDPIYQWRAIRDTSKVPQLINTSLSFLRGYSAPHMHTVMINEHILNIDQVNSTTSTIMGHNHPIINGVVQVMLGHSHGLVL